MYSWGIKNRMAILKMFTMYRIKDFAVGMTIFFIGFSYMPYLISHTQSFAYSSVRNADEMAILRLITENLYNFSWSTSYFQQFHTFGYGQIWWAFMCLILAPGYLVDSEQLMFITARLSSLLFYLSSLWVIYLCLAKYITNVLSLALLIILFLIASLTQITIIKANSVYCDTAYLFFLSLATLNLLRDNGKFGRFFSYSLVSFIVCLSIKLTPIPAGIIYFVYLILNKSNFPVDAKFITKTVITCGVTIFVLNPTFLHPELFSHFLNILNFYSEVARNGWADLQHTYSFMSSLQNFEVFYFNFEFLAFIFAFPILLTLLMLFTPEKYSALTMSLGLSRDEMRIYWLFSIPLCCVILFGLFYTWIPSHFAFATVLLCIPVAFISFEKVQQLIVQQQLFLMKSKAREYFSHSVAVLFLILALFMNMQIIQKNIHILQNTGLDTPRSLAIETIQNGLLTLDYVPSFVGVAHELGMPRIGGKKVAHWMLNELPTELLLSSDLLIFWKQDDKYKRLYEVRNLHQPQAYQNFQKIYSEQAILSEIKFEKIYEQDDILFYQARKLKNITEKEKIGNYGVNKAFDNSSNPNDFWEYPAGDQTWILIEFLDEPTSLKSYSLVTGEEPRRMPKEWKVSGRKLGDPWIIIDHQRDQVHWQENEKRLFSVKNSSYFDQIKLEFLRGNNEHVIRVYEIGFDER